MQASWWSSQIVNHLSQHLIFDINMISSIGAFLIELRNCATLSWKCGRCFSFETHEIVVCTGVQCTVQQVYDRCDIILSGSHQRVATRFYCNFHATSFKIHAKRNKNDIFMRLSFLFTDSLILALFPYLFIYFFSFFTFSQFVFAFQSSI